MDLLVQDVQTVLDTYLVDEAVYVGYSLGARVGWHAAIDGSTRSRVRCSAASPTATR